MDSNHYTGPHIDTVNLYTRRLMLLWFSFLLGYPGIRHPLSEERRQALRCALNQRREVLDRSLDSDQPLSPDEAASVDAFIDECFTSYRGIFCVNFYSLRDVVYRVDKRAEYYRYFHNRSSPGENGYKPFHISEEKRTGLFAYWLIKLKPFTLFDSAAADPSDHAGAYGPVNPPATDEYGIATVNEQFAKFFIFVMLDVIARKSDHPKRTFKRAKMRDELSFELEYAFSFRSLTDDIMMLIVELMSDAYTVEV